MQKRLSIETNFQKKIVNSKYKKLKQKLLNIQLMESEHIHN